MELLLWLALGSVVSGGGGGGYAPVRLAPCDDSVGQKWAFGTGVWDNFLVNGNLWWGGKPTAVGEQRQSGQQCGFALQAGADCDGDDIVSGDLGPSTAGACCAACASQPNCTAFTLNSAAAAHPRHCFLKRGNCSGVKVAPADALSGVQGAFPAVTATILRAAGCGPGLSMTPVGSLTANSTIADTLRWRLRNASATGEGLLALQGCGGRGYCVEATDDGLGVAAVECSASSPRQRFFFDEYGGTGVFGARGYLVNAATQTCLDAGGASAGAPTRARQSVRASSAEGAESARARKAVATPPLGWNTYNHEVPCLTDIKSAAAIMRAADALVTTGLRDAGYTSVYIGDCWMLPNRSEAHGPQVADPAKFPDGLRPVIDYIHARGLRVGLYTSRAAITCAGGAGSCRHERVDAAAYAGWGVDAVMVNSGPARRESQNYPCDFPNDLTLSCRGDGGEASMLSDYRAMHEAIAATGRPMLLSVGGLPPVRNCSEEGVVNTRRVGEDMSDNWYSMVSLVDMASGLHPYAHNDASSGAAFWNDLDQLFVGAGPFNAANASHPPGALDAARAHMTMWCLLKSPILIGSNLSAASPAILSVLSNAAALSVSQDALGVQGRRVASVEPPAGAASATAAKCGASGRASMQCDNVALLQVCNRSNALQRWRYNDSGVDDDSTRLFITPCETSDPRQVWSLPSGHKGPLSLASGSMCAVAERECSHDFPGTLGPRGMINCSDNDAMGSGNNPVRLSSRCGGSDAAQWAWTHSPGQPSGLGHITFSSGSKRQCLAVPRLTGPDVIASSLACGTPGTWGDSTALWRLEPSGRIRIATLKYNRDGPRVPRVATSDMCLTAASGTVGGRLFTVDGGGQRWCLIGQGVAGSVKGVPCESLDQLLPYTGVVESSIRSRWQKHSGGITSGLARLSPQHATEDTASGPLPHSRYIKALTPLQDPWPSLSANWTWDGLGGRSGGIIRLTSGEQYQDNDNVGSTRTVDSGDMCLALGHGGNLEVWTAPLSGGRVAVALLNRSPVPAAITASWTDLKIPASQPMEILDVWRDQRHAQVQGSWADPAVPGRGVTLLILTPAGASLGG